MQAKHLILDFQDNEFSIKEIENPNSKLETFFIFRKKTGEFSLDNLVRFGMFDIHKIQDLVLRGYITQEAEKEIRERLKSS